MDPNQVKLDELLRLTKENNHMLHKMRRNAFWGGIIKILLYAALFVALPFWLYVTYLAPVLESTMQTMNQIQGTGARAQAQFGSFQEMLQQLQQKFPSAQ